MVEAFNKAFERLNPAQRQAVETLFGPVLVVAGPGTGKTQLLTTRIAYILQKTDTNPSSILCLTFTESGANEMRRRLEQWIGPAAYQVRIHTFHGFCQSVLQHSPEHFGVDFAEYQLADDLERALLYRQVIDQGKYTELKPFNNKYYYQRAFLGTISALKRENLTPDSLRALIPEEEARLLADPAAYYLRDSKYGKKGDIKPGVQQKIAQKVAKIKELADLWEAFEAEKVRQKKYDFDDQLHQVLHALKNHPDLKADLQEQFQFLLVDEYQDTNNIQNDLIWELTDYFDDPNLFVVGDDDQAIYRFQGASLKNILDFETRFPKAQRITLHDNYRSGQKVLDASYHSVAQNLERLDSEKSLLAKGDNASTPGVIHQATFLSRSSELIWCSQQIQNLLKDGTKPQDIAILVRENREALEITRALEQLGVSVSNRWFENIFTDSLVTSFIDLLRVWTAPQLDHAFYQMLHAPFWGLEAGDLMALHLESKSTKASLATTLQKASKDNPEFKKIWELLAQSRRDYGRSEPLVVAQKLFHYSGLASWINRPGNPEQTAQLQSFKKLFSWIESQKFSDIEALLTRVELHLELEVPVFPDPLPSDVNRVSVMTAHKAKGLEFEVVFIPGLVDKVWGNKTSRTLIPVPKITTEEHDQNEDERRLFFVALTRAKQQLYLSHATEDLAGREKFPSIFWHEIPDSLVQTIDATVAETEAQKLLPVFFQTPDTPVLTGGESALLKKLAQNFIWSASSLQNYLDCPRKFLYVNLLRVPTPPLKIFGYGSAMHEAVEYFLKQYRLGQATDFSLLEAGFQQALKAQNLTELERQESFAHGRDILKNYHAHLLPRLPESVHWLLETKLQAEISGIKCTGRLDKVELSADQTSGPIVDLKSGKPSSIKPGERLWRQLVFYDLLARERTSKPWTHTEVALEWLTPDAKGEIIRKPLVITDEDRAQVKAELTDAQQKLQALDFPMIENRTQDADIEYWQNFGRWS